MTGTVLKFDDVGGFGFLRPHGDHAVRSVFFHITDVARIEGERPAISVGDEMRFRIERSERGNRTQAVECELLSPIAIAKRQLEEATRG